MNRNLLLFLVIVSFLTACGQSSPGGDAPTTGVDVIEAMKAKYDGSWYETLTFVQTTIQYRPDGQADSTIWYEGIQIPGQLRIDVESPTSGNGMLFRSDSLYMLRNGAVEASGPTMHPLLILGFDVYGQPVDDTVTKLDSIGFDLSRMHTSTWQGRDSYVIGTDQEGDFSAPQFWVDAERMVFVRLTQRVGQDLSRLQEIVFDNYTELDGGWIAKEVRFSLDSTVTMIERYADIETGAEFAEGFFHPAQFMNAEHWSSESGK